MRKKTEYTIVVTGVGALIGQGIIKALRRSAYGLRIIGVDKKPDAIGAAWCDGFYAKPRCDETSVEYIKFWEHIVKDNQVDLILPGIEIDVFFFNTCRNTGSRLPVCLNDATLITLASDKWLTGRAIEGLGLQPIPTIITGDWKACLELLGRPPFLMKPRRGNGSRGIVRLENEEDFVYWNKKSGDNFMVQKIIGSDDEEYTVGSFGFGDGAAIDPIIFRRRLSAAGNTQSAEVVEDKALAEMIARLNKRFHPIGPTNYQFRKEGKDIYLLEINPRFSSTVSMRAAFGYNEPAMAIEFFLEHTRPAGVMVTPGTASRYTEDCITYGRSTI